MQSRSEPEVLDVEVSALCAFESVRSTGSSVPVPSTSNQVPLFSQSHVQLKSSQSASSPSTRTLLHLLAGTSLLQQTNGASYRLPALLLYSIIPNSSSISSPVRIDLLFHSISPNISTNWSKI